MIYGDKFLDNNVSLSESLLIKEEENINLLINDLNVVSETLVDKVDNLYDFLIDKICEFCEKIDLYLNKFINLVKLKLLKLGNKILKKLDESINGKFEVKELPAIESEYKKDFDNGGEYKEIIESVITESNSGKKISFVSFKSPRTLINNSTDYMYNDLLIMDDFMEISQKYLDDSLEYIKGNHTDNLKNKLESYKDQFEIKYSEKREKEKAKNDLIHGLIYDLKEVKSYKEEQNFSTSNGYFNVNFVDISKKENMQELRSSLFAQINYLEKQIGIMMKHKNTLGKARSSVNSFANKSRRVLHNNSYYSIKGSYFDSPNNKYTSVFIDDVTNFARGISDTLSDDYKACASLINASIYVTKSNYRTAIQSIKFWGENAQKEQ